MAVKLKEKQNNLGNNEGGNDYINEEGKQVRETTEMNMCLEGWGWGGEAAAAADG